MSWIKNGGLTDWVEFFFLMGQARVKPINHFEQDQLKRQADLFTSCIIFWIFLNSLETNLQGNCDHLQQPWTGPRQAIIDCTTGGEHHEVSVWLLTPLPICVCCSGFLMFFLSFCTSCQFREVFFAMCGVTRTVLYHVLPPVSCHGLPVRPWCTAVLEWAPWKLHRSHFVHWR